MVSYEDEVYIPNTLKYIQLLPEKEQKGGGGGGYKNLEVLKKVNMIVNLLVSK